MSVLKGNYKTDSDITAKVISEDQEEEFKLEILKNLGGSIGYVSKKRFMWLGDNQDENV